ncbi:uncharacterized protein MELLADRAFT_107572 [Melampsora larici-populina 98AG31]|uniref:Uncharacterized protein n=1 Tax=Melampsora larici-populina (strain 98AG31 / pathotype 3-4-7) TaxID=747676 RepID=F4RQ32_MELLP|nr:uncharacterized protein MELLADRAFT_107572 [Melampsora larici-populina 98AG31]EGG05337.1 hypothetical protein MELLADRAFT_107572 [Melampsora larici-populina 98AG31]
MPFLSLGLNLAANSVVEPFFYLKQAVRLNAQNTIKSMDASTIQDQVSSPFFSLDKGPAFLTSLLPCHQDVIKSYPFELFPSNKLLTWTPQSVVETAISHNISAVMDLDNDTVEDRDTLIDTLTDGDESMVTIEGSPASSPSVQSVSCYSCGSEEERNSNGSDSSFSTLFQEDSIDNSVNDMSQKLVTSPLYVSVPHHKAIVALTNEPLAKPIVSQSCPWQEEIDQLFTDEEWDDYINELAEDLERDFQCDFEFSSDNESISRPADVVECNKGEVEARHIDGFISSPCIHSKVDDSDKSFDNLLDGESSMHESEVLDEIEQTSKGSNTQSYIIKLRDQEVPKIELTSDERHARVLRLNPHLSHLFYWED